MNLIFQIVIVVGAILFLRECDAGHSSNGNPDKYPISNASYQELNSEIGCDSKYSPDRKEDIFKSHYKNHWMNWSGEITHIGDDYLGLDIDGKGGSDIDVYFKDKEAVYNLMKGQFVHVKFVMRKEGGCFMPFVGNFTTVTKDMANLAIADTTVVDKSKIRCDDVTYGNVNYNENMDKLAVLANLHDYYWNRYHEDIVRSVCRGEQFDLAPYIEQGYVQKGDYENIKKVLE